MSTITLLLLQLSAVLGVALALGALAEKIRLPAIAGQLLGGVLLGPSLLGTFVPHLEVILFPVHNAVLKEVRTDFLQVGLLLFIFFVGLEIDIGLLGKRWRVVLPVSGLGMAVPFAVGFAAVALAPQFWAGPNKNALPWVIAVAVSISALPVIAGIIADLNLLHTHVGQMVLSCAVVDDLCGWCGFAGVAAAFTQTGAKGGSLVQLIILVLGSFLAAVTVGRALGARAGLWVADHTKKHTLAVGLALATALLASAVMEGLGAHAFFGALLVGLSLSSGHKQFLRPIERLVRSFFAPLYFGAVGLSVDVVSNFDAPLVLVVFLVACIGKLIGVSAGARIGGLGWRTSLAIASGMNARGAIEILLAVLALSVGLIDSRIFVSIVIMALATSILAGFFLQAILRLPKGGKHPRHKHPVLQPIAPSQDS